MHKKVFKIIGTIFFIIGIVSTIVGIGTTMHRLNTISNAERVTATITDIRTFRDADGYINNRAYVRYSVGGRTIDARLNWSSTNMRVGQTVELYVNRYDPYRFISAGAVGWVLALLPFIFTITFGTIGVVFLAIERRKRNRSRYLFEYGKPIWANVEGTEANWNITVNGRPAKVLVATYGNMRFVSDTVDNNDLMNIGEHVKVLVDPSDATKYTFDFHNESFLVPADAPGMPAKEFLF